LLSTAGLRAALAVCLRCCSGHTTAATFICGTLLFVLLPAVLAALEQSEEEEEGAEQPVPGSVAASAQQAAAWLVQRRWQLLGSAAALTATGRVLSKAHWVSDTLAGFCLGVALTATVALVCNAGVGGSPKGDAPSGTNSSSA
jgi:membrane-associated phospholipid phosphatase